MPGYGITDTMVYTRYPLAIGWLSLFVKLKHQSLVLP
ncbi:hypothetical protein LINGRAHAP2_LOCUS4717 [Linum grandiflorum]